MLNLVAATGLLIAYIIEGFHDKELEKLHTRKDQNATVKQWHLLDALFHSAILIVISLLFSNLDATLFFLSLYQFAAIRQIGLNTTLNILSNKPLWYLGETSQIDKILKPIERFVFFFQIASIVVITVLINKFNYIFY